jgi:hypothetical protein
MHRDINIYHISIIGDDYAEFARHDMGDVTITHICTLWKKKNIDISTHAEDNTMKKYVTANKLNSSEFGLHLLQQF